TVFNTQISIKLPKGTYGRIAPRSGLATKFMIGTGAGVIDRDYTGPIKVLIFNHSKVGVPLAKGEHIAQLIIEKIETPPVIEVKELEKTQRGNKGFGSTGTGLEVAAITLNS